ncbi:MAG: heme ABC exporter ATP-binding protein CcmA [Gammaproteobacteria bacterium]|nr:heme ABC exporter ATP-binding protein CcmA [Gammaproteobacteria bacterium]
MKSTEISVNSATCYKNNNLIFSDVSISYNDGDIGIIMGPNGCGKTTLIRSICGIQALDEGQILLDKIDIKNHNNNYMDKIIYIGHKNSLNNDFSVYENLEYLSAFDSSSKINKINEAMKYFDIYKYRNYMVSEISEGNKKKVSLARLLISQKKVWILDEPLSYLDDTAVNIFTNLVLNHQKKGGITIASTHYDFSKNINNVKYLNMDPGR